MDINTGMSAEQLAATKQLVDLYNGGLQTSREVSDVLGKDDFLKILITQLSHQDPTAPMEDKEFIAQMAQFSTLEQMTNMTQEFARLQSILNSSKALGLIGREVSIPTEGGTVTGTVEEIVGSDYPMVLVAGKYWDLDEIEAIRE